jgi:transposase
MPDLDLTNIAEHIDSRAVLHLPLVAAVVDQLHITEVVDHLCPKDPRARVSDAACVKLMILNILQGRVALYLMDHWLDRTDSELLLGAGCAADAFSDARLAAALDHLYAAGTDNVFSGVVLRYLEDWREETAERDLTLHLDTTTVKLYGEYSDASNFGPTPAFGHSKDYRPDLKQLVYGLTLHGATAMPLYGTMLDGNCADSTANRLHIQSLAELLPEDGDVTVVADCKLVDGFTIGLLESHGWHFISLVPASFSVRRTLIEQVSDAQAELPMLWEGPGRRTGEVRRYYGASFDAELGKHGNYRHLVVRSDQLTALFDKQLPKTLHKAETRVNKALRRLNRQGFSCPEDAEAAVEQLRQRLRFHTLTAVIEPELVQEKRSRPGRPRQGEQPVTRTVWRPRLDRLSAEPQRIAHARHLASHFILVTNHTDRDAWPDERILAEYRHQHSVEGHTGFRWLKGDAAVAPVFLKKPERIAALGMVMLLALAVRNFIQYTLRERLAATGRTVSDRKRRPTSNPTTETAFLGFASVQILRVVHEGVVLQRVVQRLDDHCRTVLRMLGFDEAIFTRVPKLASARAGP